MYINCCTPQTFHECGDDKCKSSTLKASNLNIYLGSRERADGMIGFGIIVSPFERRMQTCDVRLTCDKVRRFDK